MSRTSSAPPVPATAIARARRPPSETETVTLGIVIVLVAVAFRAWAIHGAWFFYDDFYFIQRAHARDLSLGYLLTPYNGHLMPAGFLLTWLDTRLDPLGFTPAAVELVVGFALAGLALLRLLVRLFGARRAVLVPLVLFSFSPILLPATTWWAAGVNQVPMLVALILATDAFVAYLREPARRHLVLNVVWLVVGLAFVERTLLGFGTFWLIGLLYFTTGPLPQRLRQLWARYRPAVLTHVVVVAAYVAFYVPWALNFDARTLVRRPFFEVVHDMVLIAFGSGFVGGPTRWRVSDVTQNEAHPSQLLLIAAWAVLVVLVVASARTRVRGLRAWLLPAYVLAANIALISVSRVIYFGPSIALDYRFQTETALLGPLAVALAFLPVVGARESSAPAPDDDGRPVGWRVDTPGWAVVACVVFVGLASVSAARFPLRNLTTTSPQVYFDNVERSSRAAPGTQLLDQTTPSWLWAPLAYPTNDYSHMFAALGTDLRITDSPTDEAFLVDDTGRFRPIVFTPARSMVPTSSSGSATCPLRLGPGSTTVGLDGPVFGVGWHVRMTYDAPRRTAATVTSDDRTRSVVLQRGRHDVLTATPGRFDYVVVTLPGDAAPVCLRDLEIGQVSPGS